MRTITIDLSNNRSSQKVFAGFEGEHNATEVEVVLPKEMISSKEIVAFYPLFNTQWNEKYMGAIIPSVTDGKIAISIHQQVTRRGCTELQIEGRDSNNNLIAKSPVGLLVFEPSVDSNSTELGMVIQDENELLTIMNEAVNKAIAEVESRVDGAVVEAEVYAQSAADSAELGAICAEQAEEHALSVQNSLQRFATIIDEQLPVYSSIYHNAAPDWVEHNVAEVDPYTWGKDVYFTADIKRGEKYLVRVWLQHQEDYNDITVMLATKNASESEQRVDDCKTPLYNQVLGCYEAEFVSVRDFAEGEEFMLFVGYPLNRENLCDETAIFGKAEILINDNLHNIVEKQNTKIAAIGGDIEAALDEIIAIQNNLIGGGSV